MDQNAVYQLFVATYNPDPNIRTQAELNIKNIESENGFLPLVLQIQATDNLELGARQAAAIYFKNRVTRTWEKDLLSDQDKQMIKASLLEALYSAPPVVQVQLSASLNCILTNDFPDQWPTFMHELERFLVSEKVRMVYVGLLALREVVKVFQWKSMERREPLRHIIQLTFPAIQSICAKLIDQDTIEAAEMLKLALKIYHASIQVELPKSLQDQNSLVPWCTLFLSIVTKRIQEEPSESHPWWKTKKWAYHCLNRLFGKYGNPATLPTKSYVAFAKHFAANFAPNILQTFLQQLDGWIKKEYWVSARCLALICEFFDECIKQKITWQILKPHTDTLIAQFLFPQICFSMEDEQLWTEDPVDYIHKKIEYLEDLRSPQTMAIHLLMDLARDRKKYAFMSMLNFINRVLTESKHIDEQQRAREKDGALRMMGALAPQILGRKSQVVDQMESFFVAHVFPEFKSPFPYLRARACDITHHFKDLEFTEEQNLGILYENLLNCLNDTEIPVRVQAALALRTMIQHESVREAMQPNLPMIMQQLLHLTNEIDIDILTNVMEEFVEAFAEHLTPFAVQLCAQLRDTFMRIMEEVTQANQQKSEEEMEEISEKTMAAMGVLKTMGTLVLSLESTPEILQQLELIVLPVITYTLQNGIMDLYDEIFEIIDSCTFSSKAISPTMWSVLELIYTTFDKKEDGELGAMHYINEMLPALENYITYGKEVFCTNEQLKQVMYAIVETLMKSDELHEPDRVCACRLMECILLNCRGSVDAYIPSFLQLAFQYISSGDLRSTEFKVYCLEVVINCIYYNPALTLRILEENQWTQGFFALWFSSLDQFTRVHDKKLTIVALCSLLSLPSDQVPVALQSDWNQILLSIAYVFKGLPNAIEIRESLEKEYRGEDDDEEEGEEEDEEEEGEEEEEEGEEEAEEGEEEEEEGEEEEEDDDDDDEENEDDDVRDEDTKYLEYLIEQAADEHAEEEEEELQEEMMFESPLDEVNPYLCFEQVFKSIQQSSPDVYHHITKDLHQEQQNEIMAVLAIAEQSRNELSNI
ncbi:ARM repeat-containing protein [Backusella circina FSU 941]|nr:ARM repeat-containing protein [Backusella circina FSU 941]